MMLTESDKNVIKKNLVNFRYIVLINDNSTELEPAEFHFRLSDLLLLSKRNIAIEMFRNSGKTSYALRAYPFYQLCYPSKENDYIVIIKQNQDQATSKLKDLISEYLSNPLLQHNKVEIKEQSAKTFSVDVYDEEGSIMNFRIDAYGKGSAIRGLSSRDRRPKTIILDDIQDKEDARSETILETDWNWFLSDINFLGSVGSRIFLIGNNLGEKCVIEKVISNAEGMNFEAIRIPVMDKDFNPSWPAQQSFEEIEKEKKKYADLGKLDIWYAEKMCQAVSQETRLFLEEDYRYYTYTLAEKMSDTGIVYAALDPASSTEKDSCFRAISIVSVMPDGHWYTLEVPYGRWDSLQLMDEMFKAAKRWGFRDFGIEKGQLQQFMSPLLYSEMTRRDTRFNIIPLEHAKRGSKLERISMLQPRFKCHSIWFPDQADWLSEMKAELAGVTRTAIKSEYIDLVDSLAMIDQMCNTPIQKDTRTDRKRANLQLEAVR